MAVHSQATCAKLQIKQNDLHRRLLKVFNRLDPAYSGHRVCSETSIRQLRLRTLSSQLDVKQIQSVAKKTQFVDVPKDDKFVGLRSREDRPHNVVDLG